MANTFLTPSVFAQEGLMLLENDLVFGSKVHTDYSKEFTKKGDTINIRKPAQYEGQDDDLDVTSYSEDILQGQTTIKMDRTVSIKVDIGAIDATLSFDRVSEDVIKPAMVKMKDRIETEIAGLYRDLYWHVGTPGTIPSTFLDLGYGFNVLEDAAVPTSDLFAMHSGDAALRLADGLKGVFVQGKVKKALEKAEIGNYAGFDNYRTVHAPTHTVGAYGGTPLIKGANQKTTYLASKDSGTMTLVTDGWTASESGLLNKGDVFTIAGVYAVNPVSKESTQRLQTFVVKEDAGSDGAGQAVLTISPAIIDDGAYQTVTAAPADNAAITVVSGAAGSRHRQSMLLHPKAIGLVSRPLKIANGAGVKTSTKQGNKVTISCTEWVDGNTLRHNMRFDMLFGAKCLDPRLGARLTS